MTHEKVPLITNKEKFAPTLRKYDDSYDCYKSKTNNSESDNNIKGGLSLFFTVLCIVDLFGVFPVITLPKVITASGFYGLPIVIAVFSVQIYTAILLGRTWSIAEKIEPNIKLKSRYPYAALAELTFGSKLSHLVIILLDITVFGAGIPNLLVASQNLQLFGLKMTEYKLDFSFCWWLIIIGILLCPLMWLGSPKDMKYLVAISVIVVTSVTIITGACILQDGATIYVAPPVTPNLSDIVMTYELLAFQFDIHPMLLTIQVDMQDRSKIGLAVVGGFFVTACMFSAITIISICKYGMNVQANILQGLPASYPLYFVVLLVTLQLCLSSAVGSSALFQHVEDRLGIDRDFNSKRCVLRASIVGFAVFLGEVVPRFDLVMGLIGSTLTGPLIFILPPLLYGRILYMRKYHYDGLFDSNSNNPYSYYSSKERMKHLILLVFQKMEIVLCIFIMIFGVMATILATYYSWADAIQYATFTPSCLINITAATRSLQL